jgi:DNA-binding winged helix-turn-helix (wHTH) protein
VRRFGVFELDLQSRELRRHGQRVRLPDQAFQILDALLSRPGEVVTREELRQKLWKAGTFVAFDVGLNNAVRKLREALDDSSEHPEFIETLPRRGYRFIGSVQDGDAGMRADPPRLPAVSRTRMVPIAGALFLLSILAIALTYERAWRLRPGSAHDIRTLAVLPFENLTGDPMQEYLADGITDTLTTHLAQMPPLSVISRTSARQYK